jgi:hypothetical protein
VQIECRSRQLREPFVKIFSDRGGRVRAIPETVCPDFQTRGLKNRERGNLRVERVAVNLPFSPLFPLFPAKKVRPKVRPFIYFLPVTRIPFFKFRPYYFCAIRWKSASKNKKDRLLDALLKLTLSIILII